MAHGQALSLRSLPDDRARMGPSEMYCAACGYHTAEIGGRHTCDAQKFVGLPRRPAAWQVIAWPTMAITAALLIASAVRIVALVQAYRVVSQVVATGPDHVWARLGLLV